jgi:hypothetical protein
VSDLREQIANEVHHSKPTHNGCSGCNRTGDAVWTNVVGPVLDAKDAEIARLRERWESSQLHCHELIDRSERAEFERDDLKATIARVKALHTRGPRTNTCNECGMTWPCSTVEALAQPGDQEGTP